MASMVWATEYLLVNLNHPWRQANSYCRTLRHRCNMARGVQPQNDFPSFWPRSNRLHGGYDPARGSDGGDPFPTVCIRYLGADVRHGEEPIL
ncbi:hypothetical protein GGR54DRAFT_135604 [Hypoxylon sp. NC1633]|nr:hypothetical protein GGR54DRAFT_135604 [Hypoxylon sp. NC1633]